MEVLNYLGLAVLVLIGLAVAFILGTAAWMMICQILFSPISFFIYGIALIPFAIFCFLTGNLPAGFLCSGIGFALAIGLWKNKISIGEYWLYEK